MEEGAVMMVGYSWERIRQAISIAERQAKSRQRVVDHVKDYSSPAVSEKVVRIILSYADYVNRRVWHKN